MLNTQRFLMNTHNALASLIHPQNEMDQKQLESPGTLKEPVSQNSYGKYLIIFTLALFLFVMIKNAWLSDDSFITLRTVDNFIHGYGLTWNIDERVQAYTHPLWMFLLSGAYFFLRNIYFSTLLLALGISAIAIAILAFRLSSSPLVAVAGLTILAASKSFIDFSTSGLENPLTHLLIVLFALVFFQYQHSKRYLLWLSLLGCLMTLNRMDTVLLFLPALLYALYESPLPRWKALRTLLLAFLPFLVWELFSLFYYGFLFPNTAYAKLNTGVPSSELVKQGIGYLISSSTFDPLFLIILISALLLTVVERDRKSILLALGMMLYLAYIVRVGGDFMAGRFLTPPFLMAVLLLMRNIPSRASLLWVVILVVAVCLGFVAPNSRWYIINPQSQLVDSRGVADEHAYFGGGTGLINYERSGMPSTSGAHTGMQLRFNHVKVAIIKATGALGYEAGPQVHIIDFMGLGDPLLARLPMDPNLTYTWRIGHFQRIIPTGYLETIKTGKNVIQDPDLAHYYAHLHNVVSGPLFSRQRLLEIWKFNTGAYNSLLRNYINSLPAPPPPPTTPLPQPRHSPHKIAPVKRTKHIPTPKRR